MTVHLILVVTDTVVVLVEQGRREEQAWDKAFGEKAARVLGVGFARVDVSLLFMIGVGPLGMSTVLEYTVLVMTGSTLVIVLLQVVSSQKSKRERERGLSRESDSSKNRKSYVSLLTRTVDILLSVVHFLAVCVAVTVTVRVGES